MSQATLWIHRRDRALGSRGSHRGRQAFEPPHRQACHEEVGKAMSETLIKSSKLQVYYDPETDTLSLWNGHPACEANEVGEGLTADFDSEGRSRRIHPRWSHEATGITYDDEVISSANQRRRAAGWPPLVFMGARQRPSRPARSCGAVCQAERRCTRCPGK